MLQNAAHDKADSHSFSKRHDIHQNLAVALPPLQCLPWIFISVCQRPRVQTTGDPDDIWLPSFPEYWLQCLSVHYSSKLMMQGTACCLQFSVWVERGWQKRLVFCEQHVINSLGAYSLRVDDYSLWYIAVYFWVHCTTSCAIFLPPLFLLSALIQHNLFVWWVSNQII